jgi:hypothetical protein
MKESERIEKELLRMDNDFSAWTMRKKYARALRAETFEDEWLPRLQEALSGAIFKSDKKGCYTMNWTPCETCETIVIDYYPSADKVLIRKNNEWKTNGLEWLKSKLVIK